MKFKIIYREYHYTGTDQLRENIAVAEARSFEIESGFVGIFTEHNETQIPDIAINANDVLTIEPIKEEGK